MLDREGRWEAERDGVCKNGVYEHKHTDSSVTVTSLREFKGTQSYQIRLLFIKQYSDPYQGSMTLGCKSFHPSMTEDGMMTFIPSEGS